MRAPVLAAVVVVVWGIPFDSAGGQSLAEAARRAEEARKSSSGSSRVFTNRTSTDESPSDAEQISQHELTLRNLQAFMNTRKAYAKMLVADADLRGRMQVRLASAKTIEAVIAAWDGEPAVLALIKENGTTPREFMLTELAVAQAALLMQAMAANTLTEALPPVLEKNVQLVKARWAQIEAFSKEVLAIAAPLQQ
jgi:hypothetical protein